MVDRLLYVLGIKWHIDIELVERIIKYPQNIFHVLVGKQPDNANFEFMIYI